MHLNKHLPLTGYRLRHILIEFQDVLSTVLANL